MMTNEYILDMISTKKKKKNLDMHSDCILLCENYTLNKLYKVMWGHHLHVFWLSMTLKRLIRNKHLEKEYSTVAYCYSNSHDLKCNARVLWYENLLNFSRSIFKL